MSDLISRADALEQMAQAECGLHYDDCEADNCSCSYIQRILDIPSAELPKGDLISRTDTIEAVRSRLYQSAMNNDGEARETFADIAENRIEVWINEVPSADAEQGLGRYENAMQKLRDMPRYLNGVKEKQITKISADAVSRKAKCCPITETCMSIDCPVSSEYIGRPLPKPYKGGDSK